MTMFLSCLINQKPETPKQIVMLEWDTFFSSKCISSLIVLLIVGNRQKIVGH